MLLSNRIIPRKAKEEWKKLTGEIMSLVSDANQLHWRTFVFSNEEESTFCPDTSLARRKLFKCRLTLKMSKKKFSFLCLTEMFGVILIRLSGAAGGGGGERGRRGWCKWALIRNLKDRFGFYQVQGEG